MTREKITTLFEKTFYHEYIGSNGYMVAPKHKAWEFIDKVVDDFENQRCQNCVWYDRVGACSNEQSMMYDKLSYDKFGCNEFVSTDTKGEEDDIL